MAFNGLSESSDQGTRALWEARILFERTARPEPMRREEVAPRFGQATQFGAAGQQARLARVDDEQSL